MLESFSHFLPSKPEKFNKQWAYIYALSNYKEEKEETEGKKKKTDIVKYVEYKNMKLTSRDLWFRTDYIALT